MKIIPWYCLVLKIIAYGLGFLAIYWLILKLANHSPTSGQVIFAVLGFIATFVVLGISLMVKVIGDLREFQGQFVQHIKHCDAELDRILSRRNR